MKDYELKAVPVVSAEQFRVNAFQRRQIENGTGAFVLDEHKIDKSEDRYLVTIEDNTFEDGDWIVRDADGTIRKMSDADFNATYRPSRALAPNHEQVTAAAAIGFPASQIPADVQLPPLKTMQSDEGEDAVNKALEASDEAKNAVGGALSTSDLAGNSGAGAHIDKSVGGNLPEDFPHRELLAENGLKSYARLAAASDEDLLAIPGVGQVKLAAIREAADRK